MKTKIYTLVFVLLLGFVAYTLYSKSAEEKEAKKDKNFKVENFEEVTELRIIDKQGVVMSFKPKGSEWILNDKLVASKDLFNNMKRALTTMEAFNPIPKVASKSVIYEMIEHAIKIEVYKGDSKPEKTIYVGGPNLTNTASSMFIEYDGVPSKKIYEVGIPGHRGHLTTWFMVDEKNWKSKKIFEMPISNFKEIKFKYFKNIPLPEFAIEKNNDEFSLTIESEKKNASNIDETKIISYVHQLEKQYAIAYYNEDENDKEFKDSVLIANKFAEISLTDINNKTINLTIVDMPLNKGSKTQFDNNGDYMTFDVDYKYVIFGEKNEWAIINNSNFGRLYIDANKFLK